MVIRPCKLRQSRRCGNSPTDGCQEDIQLPTSRRRKDEIISSDELRPGENMCRPLIWGGDASPPAKVPFCLFGSLMCLRDSSRIYLPGSKLVLS
ncbi:hypothetical protein X801_08001 [Opisthorchis viverrini]|uniref:Uncharacterized protein n=2 Tax=Opisthorchis viverrini TaxID=6198 RepID=A0A1S8WNX1_OPIVI|nr:hypothetical protein T265_02999 [Opisthorchis viverrini]KER30650.1 hypothetical protein T265_02999 [Opisthorchis viverrini]OON16190.1 hypothetical protein X801_08001 [Opisthorchis viverrini]